MGALEIDKKVEKAVLIEAVSNNEKGKGKETAAILSFIDSYAQDAQDSSDQNASGLGSDNSANNQALPSDQNNVDDSSNSNKEEKLPPLLALIMAGITIEGETNKLMTSLGNMSSAMTTATTNAATAESDALKEFYQKGKADGTIADDTSESIKIYVDPKGNIQLSVDGGNTYTNAGKYSDKMDHLALPDGYYVSTDQQKEIIKQASTSYYDRQGDSFWGYDNGSTIAINANGETGGIMKINGGSQYYAESANSSEQAAFIAQYQKQQNDANSVNSGFGLLSGLASSGMQELTQSVATAEGNQSSTAQANSQFTSMISGWAGQ